MTRPAIPARQPRALGEVRVSVGRDRDDVTRLRGLRQAGSLKLMFPRQRRPGMEAVLVNTAGGLTGGDRFALSAEIGPEAGLTLTTQAAERAYRAQPGEVAELENRLSVGPGGRLDWLPQETILFDGSALRRRLRIELAPDARLLMVEPLVFGRVAMGEVLHQARFSDRIAIWREGRPLYLDGVELDGDVAALLARPATAAGGRAMASLVYAGPEAPAHLETVRRALPATGGASLRGDDLLVMRVVARDSHLLRRTLVPILDRLSAGGLPNVWRL